MKSFHLAVFPADGIGAEVIAASRQVLSKLAETAHGGHLLEARVHPTCELVLIESPRTCKNRWTLAPGSR